MTIHIVTGPPCAGKSTYANAQRDQGTVIVDYDALAKAFGSPGHHDHPLPVGQVTMAARHTALARIFKGIDTDAWVLTSFLTQEKADEYAAAGCYFHLLDPGLEECLRRAEEDNRPEGTADRIRQWYETRATLPEDLTTVVSKGTNMQNNPTNQTRTKAFDVTALAETEEGVFEGYASVFGNVDSYGDMVVPGAFSESLKSYGANGAGIPCYWSHRVDDPLFNIGVTTQAVEDSHGLKVTVKLDTDTERGQHVYRLLKEKRVTQMSFMYTIKSGAWVDTPGANGSLEGFYELREVDIHEVSVVAVGANQQTEILDVKASGSQAEACTCHCSCAKADHNTTAQSIQSNAEEPDAVNAEDSTETQQPNHESVLAQIAVMEITATSSLS